MTTNLGTDGEIVVDGSTDYETRVSGIVNEILATKTGLAIATKVKAHGKILITDSYTRQQAFEVNADFEPSRSSKSLAIISYSSNYVDIYTSAILFNGEPITVGQFLAIRKNYAGQRSDEMLMHEMTHAARYLGGDLKMTPLKGTPQADYENEEDFFAILVTNIYCSERGRSSDSFRKSHHLKLKGEMGPDEALPDAFILADGNYQLVAKFCKQHTKIAPMIATAKADFNPIRDYYDLENGVAPALNLKAAPEQLGPIQIVQYEPRVPVTDAYLISLLEPRFRADDVAGYGARARKVEQVFNTMIASEALPLLKRVLARQRDDKVATLFHDHLATATRNKLVGVLARKGSS